MTGLTFFGKKSSLAQPSTGIVNYIENQIYQRIQNIIAGQMCQAGQTDTNYYIISFKLLNHRRLRTDWSFDIFLVLSTAVLQRHMSHVRRTHNGFLEAKYWICKYNMRKFLHATLRPTFYLLDAGAAQFSVSNCIGSINRYRQTASSTSTYHYLSNEFLPFNK